MLRHRICAIAGNLSELDVTAFGNARPGVQFTDPYHIWVGVGHGYVTDYTDSLVKEVSLSDASVTTLAGKAGEFGSVDGMGAAARFGEPAGIWGDGNNVFVTDAYFDTVRSISLSTGAVTTLAGSSNSPAGFADGVGSAARFQSPSGLWGSGGILYVCDSLNFTVRRIAIATGEVTTLAGTARVRGAGDGVGSEARFYAPRAIWGDGTYLYVADGGAIRIVTIATGEVRTLTGSPSMAGYLDGAAADARFSFISGVWGDGGENLFVADSGNNIIRKVSLQTGFVTTIAGLSSTSGYKNGLGQAARFDNPTGIGGDGAAIYLVDRMNSIIRRGGKGLISSTNRSPRVGTTRVTFELEDHGGASKVTGGASDAVQTGYGKLSSQACCPPSGMAIVGYRRDGVLLSETTVPAVQLIRSGRVPVEINDHVSTGIAVANPNAETAILNYYFTDVMGSKLYWGALQIPGGGLIAEFLNKNPFAPPNEMGIDLTSVRTFTFSSSAPIGVTALRELINERSDFLISTLPIVPIALTNSSPLIFAHYADGGGWKTNVILVNPTEITISGVANFFGGGSLGSNGAPNRNSRETLSYSIAPSSSVTLQLTTRDSEIRTGWIQVTPSGGMPSPSGFLVFSYESDGITVTQTGIPAAPVDSLFRILVEASGDFRNAEPGSIQTGFALANPSTDPAIVNVELFTLNGISTGLHALLRVEPYGQIALFLDQLPELKNLATPFQGSVEISGSPVTVMGLRGRYNERGSFLITPTEIESESVWPATSAGSIFPYFVDGGGYTTQFVLFGRTLGEAANGVLTFFDPTGEVLPLPIR